MLSLLRFPKVVRGRPRFGFLVSMMALYIQKISGSKLSPKKSRARCVQRVVFVAPHLLKVQETRWASGPETAWGIYIAIAVAELTRSA